MSEFLLPLPPGEGRGEGSGQRHASPGAVQVAALTPALSRRERGQKQPPAVAAP